MKSVSRDRVQQHTDEHIVDEPLPQTGEETVDAVKIGAREQFLEKYACLAQTSS